MLVELRNPWENGYSEFFDRRRRRELLDREICYTRQEAQILIEWWRQRYTTVRRHGALADRPPAPEAVAWTALALSPRLALEWVGLN